MAVKFTIVLSLEIGYLGGLGVPGGPGDPSKRWRASPPTSALAGKGPPWNGLLFYTVCGGRDPHPQRATSTLTPAQTQDRAFNTKEANFYTNPLQGGRLLHKPRATVEADGLLNWTRAQVKTKRDLH